MKRNISMFVKAWRSLPEEKRSLFVFIYDHFWHINWLKTIWFNFRVLKWKQAVKLPFVLSFHVDVREIGQIRLPSKCYFGMISLGVKKIYTWESNRNQIVFSNKGTVVFHGFVKIHPGVIVSVAKHAVLSIGERNTIGANSKVVAQHTIILGDDFRISWNGQIFDTDFHFLTNANSGKIYSRKKPIIIGKKVFAGNSVTIGKGTIIPDGSVISCCSKVCGDFSDEGDNLLIVGNPAKVVNKGYEMSNGDWFPKVEDDYATILLENEMIKEYNEQLLKLLIQ